jgi:excinuclease ABC subunit C
MPAAQDGTTPGLFAVDVFPGFGPSRFRPAGEVPPGRRLRTPCPKALQAAVREHAPQRPGIYGMIDGRQRVIYIGKAKNLRARLLSYFRPNSRHPKAGKIVAHTRVLVWEETADELAALLRELELIRHFKPRFNVQGMPGPRRYVYLCLGREPAAFAYTTRDPTGKEVAAYGPLVGRGRLQDVVRRLNDWFGLRDCPQFVPMVFADQPELFPEDRSPRCLRYDLGNCLGPCVGACSRADYRAKVRAAKQFLDGRDRTPLKELTKRIKMAANELKFEQAISLRDRLLPLTWIDDRLTFLRTSRQQGSYVYPLPCEDGRVMWYLIHAGEVQAVVREPRVDAARLAATELMRATFVTSGPAPELTYKTVDSVLLVHAWFKRNATERAKLLTAAQAFAFCEPAPLASLTSV